MDNNLLERLKNLALRFHIDPQNTIGHAAKVETIIKVLSDINKSYKNFLEIEFKKNGNFLHVYEKNNNILQTFIDELDLLAVDLNFGSFDISVAPNIVEKQSPIFKDEILDWKKESFKNYKAIISGDLKDQKYIQKISNNYSEQERKNIYAPLFNSISSTSKYSINIKNKSGKIIRTLQKPTKESIKFYVPKIISNKPELEEKTVRVYVKLKAGGDEITFKKGNIKEIYHIEELEYDTYPYTPDYLQFSKNIFLLNRELECKVEFENDNYIIRNEAFDITVWGDTRVEAEEAFSFSFYSLYVNFYNEKDKNLSKEAKSLKGKLKKLIKQVIDEAKKN